MVKAVALPYSTAFVAIGLATLVIGCKKSSDVQSSTPAPQIVPVKDAVSPDKVRFARATLFKPDSEAPDSDARMAPMILFERSSKSPQTSDRAFGALRVNELGRAVVDHAQPAVYVFEDEENLNGVAYKRIAHLWFYEIKGASPSTDQVDFSCVQMTLNEEGAPVIWHVFDSRRSGADVVYVSRSIESAAVGEYGPPKSGLKFSVERTAGVRNVRVVRLIDDGPEPMGPMLYVSNDPNVVATLTCRCMPSQVDEIENARSYRLIRSESADETNASLLEQIQLFFESNSLRFDKRISAFLSRELDDQLRLPAAF